MRLLPYITYGFAATSTITAASLPEDSAHSLQALHNPITPRSENILSPANALSKRKGGGGGGGKGGGGGGGGGGGKTSTNSGTSRTSPNSNTGGSTKYGSGAPRGYGGGGYYGGGGSTPYPAGTKTPKGLVAGALVAPAALLLIFPGLWLYSAYPYHFSNPYRFYNETYRNGTQQGMNESLPVTCYCQESFSCGCEQNEDGRYMNELVGNGSYDALNKTLVNVADVDGKKTLLLNGTLPNGTTAPGGVDDAGINLKVGKWAGYWVMGVIVLSTVTML